ncbi:MAG: FAD-dependent oxidoreductase [Rhodospirillales bacterium]|nr:FAD-dependent oxidoreductase [Rhodospirillales bacterium]MCB9965895.1 FAD-dependent oxidoreductase [Rhodospirillales bacterium]MCB9973658.1 FAD-dependent oxidoreductase [Rhodospirillales bacterium]MCB9980646.1 FAD-dependent oxidoreductase [Rhodospirillales bacterium]
MKIAIIGAGIAGLGAAWLLHKTHDVSVFEAAGHLGGMAHTIELPGHPAIDTGFTVFNRHTSPNLLALLEHFDLPSIPCDFSCSISLPDPPLYLSAEKEFPLLSNSFSPRYWKLRLAIRSFWRALPSLRCSDPAKGVERFFKQARWSEDFIKHYLLPLAAMIWRGTPAGMSHFPAARFLDILRSLHLSDPTAPSSSADPEWFVLSGGGSLYINALSAPFRDRIQLNTLITDVIRHRDCVEIVRKGGHSEQYDHVILAVPCDLARSLLSRLSKEEEIALSGIHFEQKDICLHQNTDLMPPSRKLWTAFNFLEAERLHNAYITRWINRLPSFADRGQNYFVTLGAPPPKQDLLYKTSYPSPQFTGNTFAAWESLPNIQGKQRTWFCGAWCGDGFHEDALSSGLAIGEALGGELRPWSLEETSPAARYCVSK